MDPVHSAYEPSELERIRRALDSGKAPTCPRCDTLLEQTDVPPRSDVSYVRDRAWLVCSGCGAGGVVDRSPGARGTAGDPSQEEGDA